MGQAEDALRNAELPKLEDGTLTLLSIALKNDRDKRLSRGPAIRAANRYLIELPERCRAGAPAVCQMLGVERLPSSLFSFCGLLLDAIERQIIESTNEPRGSTRWARSEYEHPILLAVGQTVSRAVGITAAAGPDMPTVITRLASADPSVLQQQLIANYLGNVLQDYFDACEVRFNVRDLPEDTEDRLRQVEARAMAGWVFRDAPILPLELLEQRLGQLMTAAFLEEDKRTQARRERMPLKASEGDESRAQGPSDRVSGSRNR